MLTLGNIREISGRSEGRLRKQFLSFSDTIFKMHNKKLKNIDEVIFLKRVLISLITVPDFDKFSNTV